MSSGVIYLLGRWCMETPLAVQWSTQSLRCSAATDLRQTESQRDLGGEKYTIAGLVRSNAHLGACTWSHDTVRGQCSWFSECHRYSRRKVTAGPGRQQ